MSDRSEPRHDRQYNQVVIAVSLVLAVSLLAISLPAISSALESGAGDGSPVPFTDNESPSYAIGAGPVGESRVSPVGMTEGSDREVTPFRNQSNASLFTVQTAAPGYWRVDAYNRYDGEWVRAGDGVTYRSAIPASRPVTVQVEQNISVKRPVVALPGAYQAATVETNQTTEFTVSPETGVHPSSALPANSTYTMGSYRYRPSPASLQDAGTDYPVSIEERYTQLPPGYSEDVAELGAVMTEEAETPYAKAATIAESLEESRNYSLSATHEADADPVEQFLYEMDEGDSTYFASSMVTLLRTQDVPARYVTGYSVGEPVGDDRYEVRQVNAHAWVEVYFPGHGWIAFDPTPTAQRLAVEDAAVGEPGTMAHVPLVHQNASELGVDIDQLIEVRLGDLAEEQANEPTTTAETPTTTTTTPTTTDDESGTGEEPTTQAPTETPDDDGGDGTGDGGDGEGESSPPAGSTEDGTLSATLSTESPAPGDQLTVTVSRDEAPVENASVWFNSEFIGTTNASGQVTGTVPYAEQLDVVAATDRSPESPPESLAPLRVGGASGSDERFYAVVTEHLPVAPNASPPAGPSVTDHARVGQDSTAGTSKGETRPVQSSTAGAVFQVDTESGDADENTTVVSVPVSAAVSMTVEPEPVVAGGTAVVQMQVNEQPVEDATVRVDGQDVGTTNADGEYTLQVSDSSTSQTIELRRGELVTQRSVPIGALSLRAVENDGVRLPGQTVTLQARVGGTPISDVPVRTDSGVVGTTSNDGTIQVTLPVAQSTAYAVTYGGQEVQYAAQGMLVNAFLISVASLGWVGLLVLGARRLRRGKAGVTRVEARLEHWGGRLFSRVLAIGSWMTAQLLAVETWASSFWNRVSNVEEVSIAGVLGVLKQPTRLVHALSTAVGALIAILQEIVSSDAETTVSASNRAAESSTAVESDNGRLSIREAWWRFVRLAVSRVEPTNTPTEVARNAIDAGVPEGPVTRLLESFRAVEYGRGEPDQHAETASAAVEELEASHEEIQGSDSTESRGGSDTVGER